MVAATCARVQQGTLYGIAGNFDSPPYSERMAVLKMAGFIEGCHLLLKEQL